MSEQILLQGKFLGVEEFLLSPAGDDEAIGDLLPGRAQWISLLCEALPRALLAELGLARILLGSSGGAQDKKPGDVIDAEYVDVDESKRPN